LTPGQFVKCHRMTDTQKQIAEICDQIKTLLLEKNKKYGDSALNPTRVFSKANTLEQLYVRIDDKLSRISRGAGLLGSDEDVINDLIGYLVLMKIALLRQSDRWDGTDIHPNYNPLWKTPDVLICHGKKFSSLNDTEWLDMYASGDRFA